MLKHLYTAKGLFTESPKPQDLYQIGLSYLGGKGRDADLSTALKWLNLAAIGGHQHAKDLCREISEVLTPQELEQAFKGTLGWMKLTSKHAGHRHFVRGYPATVRPATI